MPRYLASLFFVALIVIVMAGSFYAQPVNKGDNSRKEFVIAQGENLDQIASDLSKAGLIRSRTVFKVVVLIKNLSKKIQAGYFSLTPAQSTGEIAVRLTKASVRQVWVTIPEGLRREEVANLVLDKLVESKMPHHFDPEEFIRLTAKLEGRLFPNTYALAPNVTTQDVIEKLNGEFAKVVAALNIPADQLNRVVTLASIVEREAGSDEERSEVAGVLTNRLKAGAALRVDASVQYAISSARCRIRICDWWPKSLTRTDIAFASSYNTYQNPGLPPGPIDNPGKASLEAALKPKATKYWYYLHDSSGQIHYAVTLEEHNQNICTYLKKDC
jgi:UPF0755 protein